MPKYNKPDKLNVIWGINALSGDNVYPSDDYAKTGWFQVKPPYQYENAINQKHDQWVAYSNQLGLPEWDSTTEYQANKSYIQASDNRVYKCIQTHSNRNPATAGNESFWELFEGNRQATTSKRGTVEFATSEEVGQMASETLAVNPAGLLDGLLGGGILQDNGYIEIPVNVEGNKRTCIVQFDNGNSITGNQDIVSFPTPFPNKVFQVVVCEGAAAGWGTPPNPTIHGVSLNDRFSFKHSVVRLNSGYAASVSFRYIAIGY